MPNVFISHAHGDAEFAAQVGEGLSSRGIAVWLDEDHVEPGAEWATAVEKAIRESRNVLFVLSQKTSQSSWLRTEAAIALAQGGKRVIPIYSSKDAEIPFMLRPFKGLDLSEPAAFESGMARLADLVREDAPETGDRGEASDQARARMAMAKRSLLEVEVARYEADDVERNRAVARGLSIFGGLVAMSTVVVVIASATAQQALLPLVALGGGVAGFALGRMLGRFRRTAKEIEGRE